MDLSTVDFTAKPFRVIPVYGGSLLADFVRGKFRILGLECNAKGVYGSPLQKSIKERFPNVGQAVSRVDYAKEMTIGRTHLIGVSSKYTRDLFVANMHIMRNVGFGANSRRDKTKVPANRFSPKYLTNAFEDLLAQCAERNITPDRQIAVQRFYGGLGGVAWEEVCGVLDEICVKHQFNMYAYLPDNYNSNYVRGGSR